HRDLPSFPTRRSSDLEGSPRGRNVVASQGSSSSVGTVKGNAARLARLGAEARDRKNERNAPRGSSWRTATGMNMAERVTFTGVRSEEHTSELQSLRHL